MKIRPFLIFLLSLWTLSFAYSQQELDVKGPKQKERQKPKMPSKAEYLKITIDRDTIPMDTILRFEKGLRHNVANRDLFEYIPFSNPGRPMNKMTRETPEQVSGLGVPMQHYMLYEKEDIHFHRNPTPLTEFFFLSILNRGQLLNSNLAFNLSEQFNMSLGFRGFRSEGHYVSELVNSGSFRTTFNYTSENKKYQLRAFMTTHNMNQLEPAGLKFAATQFDSGNPQFLERRYVDQLMENADSRVLHRAFYADQIYSLAGALALTQSIHYDSRAYLFNQSSANSLLGELNEGSTVSDKHGIRSVEFTAGVALLGKVWGTLEGSIRQLGTRQGFENLAATTQDATTSETISSPETFYSYSDTHIKGRYTNQKERVGVKAEVYLPLQATLQGFVIDTKAYLKLGDSRFLRGWFEQRNQLPALNMLRYQSNYTAFNWDIFEQSAMESHVRLKAELEDKRFGSISAQVKTLNNGYFFEAPISGYTGLGTDYAFLNPVRANEVITERALAYSHSVQWRKLTLALKGLYQESDDTSGLYNIPKFIARAALYVSTDLFDKAMFAHIGVKGRYFDDYYADGYHPALGVFYSQQHSLITGYAVLDAFVYAKVRTMDLFLTYEHMNAAWGSPSFYAAPGVPFRDGVLRFGFTWNFFD